ncbi:unnamed protein product [Linum trigynum]|uniref:Uncharacterized protein n=1 Tax=Linum trigynum TaxID=586398 RepID=A0AAV2E752_9ROSI
MRSRVASLVFYGGCILEVSGIQGFSINLCIAGLLAMKFLGLAKNNHRSHSLQAGSGFFLRWKAFGQIFLPSTNLLSSEVWWSWVSPWHRLHGSRRSKMEALVGDCGWNRNLGLE